MMNYKYMVVDAQLVLRKAYDAIRGLDHFDKPFLKNTFLASIKKTKRDFENLNNSKVQKILLAWDKAPYHRAELVEEYKGDRLYLTEDDLEVESSEFELEYDDIKPFLTAASVVNKKDQESVNQWVKENLSADRIELIQEEKKRLHVQWVTRELAQKKIFNFAKKEIITEWATIGLPSLMRPGYEADDLGYLVAKYAKLKDDERVILVTVDNDWPFYCNETTDYWQYKRAQLTTIESLKVEITGDPKSPIDVFEFKRYMDSLQGNHNNLDSCITDDANNMTWLDLIPLIKANGADQYVTDKKLFSTQFSTFDIESFPEFDEVLKDLDNLDKVGSLPNSEQFSNRIHYLGLGVSYGSYAELENTLNKSLFLDEVPH